jgi:GxxExxY protein
MFHTDEAKARADELSNIIIGAAIEVHRELGPGLLESAYEACLKYELESRGLQVLQQLELPVIYKGIQIDCAHRIDLLVENTVVIELKAVDKLDKIHDAQTITYLRLSKRWLGC